MKRILLVMLVSIATLTVFSGRMVFAEDALTSASSYEAKIHDLDAEIAKHEAMKKDHETRPAMDGKFGKKGSMSAHCDAIIKAAQALKAEYTDMAEAYRMQQA